MSGVMRRLATILLATAVTAACALLPSEFNGDGAPRQAAIVPLQSERPVVALALGGGGARGFAHVGVIKALEDAGIEADVVTGASSGAVVAALYAAGHRGGELRHIALTMERDDIVDFVVIGKGWVKGEALQNFVNRLVDERPIEALPRRFALVATEAKSYRMTVFNRGNTGVAVRASASVPNLFIPPVINGEEYLDGGLTSPVPVKLARAMGADIVIAVDVSWFAQAGYSMRPVSNEHRRRSRHELLAAELDAADIVITPQTVRTRMLDFDHREQNIDAGEKAGRDAAVQIHELIKRVAARKRTQRASMNDGR
jgi:NTE family protein